jgi:hypothetical protein
MKQSEFGGKWMELDAGIFECLCIFETLRSLGFRPDEIYIIVVEFENSNGSGIRVELRTHKGNMIIDIGILKENGARATERCKELATIHNREKGGENFREKYHQSWVWKNRELFVAILVSKGLHEGRR